MTKEGRPITPSALREARKDGFETAFFVDGDPKEMIMSRGNEYFTATGKPVTAESDIKLGIFKRAKGGE